MTKVCQNIHCRQFRLKTHPAKFRNKNREKLFKVSFKDTHTWTILKLGFHCGDHIWRPRLWNLIVSDSSPKVCRQSIPTNCPQSLLNSFFVFIDNRFKSNWSLERNLLNNFQDWISSVNNNIKFQIFQKYFQNVQLFSINQIKKSLNVYANG